MFVAKTMHIFLEKHVLHVKIPGENGRQWKIAHCLKSGNVSDTHV